MSTAYIWKDRTKVSLILKQKRKKVDEKKKKSKDCLQNKAAHAFFPGLEEETV